jgi:hypothetical protein
MSCRARATTGEAWPDQLPATVAAIRAFRDLDGRDHHFWQVAVIVEDQQPARQQRLPSPQHLIQMVLAA